MEDSFVICYEFLSEFGIPFLMLFRSSIFHLLPLLVILLTLASGRSSEGNLDNSGTFQTAGDGIIEGIHFSACFSHVVI